MSPTSVDVRNAYREQVARGIRRLDADDAEQVADILDMLGYPQGGTGLQDRVARWADAGDDTAAFVWDERGTLLGVVAVHVIPSFEKDGCWLRIVALAVHEDARGRGIGTSLVAAAEQFARERGCSFVEVTSQRKREGAHAFYHALGYRDRSEEAGRFLRSL